MDGRALTAFLFGAMTAACATSKGKPALARPPASEDLPAMVVVERQTAQLGLWRGRLTEKVAVDGFSIAKYPISQGAYQTCIAANACPPAAADCKFRSDGEQIGSDATSPARCVGISGATAYCAWVGSKLPTPAQWLVAARGAEIARFPWGAAPPNCAQHPLGRLNADEANERGLPPEAFYELFHGQRVAPCVVDVTKRFRIAEHPGGASPAGMEDVLLTAGELVASVDETIFPACRSPRPGCIATTEEQPGSIDSFSRLWQAAAVTHPTGGSSEAASVEAAGEADTDSPAHQNVEYGFRCVTEVSP